MTHIEDAERIVSGTPTRHVLNNTGFFVHLWRDFPNLSRDMRRMVERRTASGRLKRERAYMWLIGTGGLHVEHGDPRTRGSIGYPVVLDELLERGRAILVAVEWDSRE